MAPRAIRTKIAALARAAALGAAIWLCLAASALPEKRGLTLAADDRLAASGLLDYLVPRFSLKHAIRITVIAVPAAATLEDVAGAKADVLLVPRELAGAVNGRGRARPAFHVAGGDVSENWSVVVPEDTGAPENAARFADWLLSEIGQRTIAGFDPTDRPAYTPGTLKIARTGPDLPEGDIDAGEKLARLHCGRCHVVSQDNPFGGIGSTPSFAAMRSFDDWEDKFTTFWSLNPHPSFTRVEGLTGPFDPMRPPHIAPVEMTQQDLQAIVAFAARIKAKDLGPEIDAR